ncbi:MAG: peptidylprolyl isomerase [Planctomycetaceae bacterium]|jgi:cyclophilin family peptidyl-prolyl cis-trans isomerase|nr:peptidylprolyl isomerase [Planctomycetaceae bacterium]
MRFIVTFLAVSFLVGSFLTADEHPPKPATQPVTNTEANAPAGNPVERADDSRKPANNYVQSDAEAEALGPKNKTFIQEFVKFRELGKKLTALKIEYQDAKPDRQETIDAEYPKLYQEGLGLHKQLLELAMEAHKEAPNRNPFVSNLLYSTVDWDFQRENYEESVRIFKELVKGGTDKEAAGLYTYAGLAALLTMDLPEAEAWLKKAEESGNLEKVFKSMEQRGGKNARDNAGTLQMMMQMLPNFQIDWAKEREIRKSEKEAGEKDPNQKLPRVEFETTKGKIVLELFENEAPNTVANFISLAERGFYNGTPFHRVLPLFMAQGGDPTGSGNGGPGYNIDDECGPKYPKMRKHFRGSISMANAGQNTNGSQFFLTFVPTSFLDGKHTVFGRVAEGMEVLADIQRVDPADKDAKIPELDKIVTAKVLNKRNHPYEPKKNGNRR